MTGTIAHNVEESFEQQYLSLREKEQRIYSDEEVFQLPDISRQHPHYNEWQCRKESAKRLRNYFEKRSSLLKILEVGCGNGWLSHYLAYIPGCSVTGTDVNFQELQQASRVFSHIPNLKFAVGGIEAKGTEGLAFDFIVFASSIQYFPSLAETIWLAQHKLKPGGEIHILDTPFYKEDEVNLARQRTEEYYQRTGFPGMANFYYHHTIDSLQGLPHRILYEPSFFNRHFLQKKSPFPWIQIPKCKK